MQAGETQTPLKKFKAPNAPLICTFESDEITAVCPFEYGSGRDFYRVTIRYEPDGACIEGKSLRDWVRSLDNEEFTAERLAAKIFHTVTRAIAPERCYVRLEQNRRGGWDITQEVGDVELRQ